MCWPTPVFETDLWWSKKSGACFAGETFSLSCEFDRIKFCVFASVAGWELLVSLLAEEFLVVRYTD